MIRYMRMYGSATNFHGGPGEEHHKESVKKTGHNTQRRPVSFTCQVSQRSAEANIISYSHKFIRNQCLPEKAGYRGGYDYSLPIHPKITSDKAVHMNNKMGTFDIRFASGRGRPGRNTGGVDTEYTYDWKDSKKNKLKLQPHSLLIHGLTAHAQSIGDGRNNQNIPCPYTVRCYTELRIPTQQGYNKNQIYRASPDYRGSPWYDWALVKDEYGGKTYIGQIVGFFQYLTGGIRTVKHHLDDTDPVDGSLDPTLYVVLQCSEHCFTKDDLEKKMITPFSMLREPKPYVLPISCLLCPLIVISNWGDDCTWKKLAVLPYHSWGILFKNRIRFHQEMKAPPKPSKSEWDVYKNNLRNKTRQKNSQTQSDEESADEDEIDQWFDYVTANQSISQVEYVQESEEDDEDDEDKGGTASGGTDSEAEDESDYEDEYERTVHLTSYV